jgi:hypothetical protein
VKLNSLPVTVTMELFAWEREKAEIRDEAYRRGQADGHQSFWQFIDTAVRDPLLPIHFGKGFPEGLRAIVQEVVDGIREKRKRDG